MTYTWADFTRSRDWTMTLSGKQFFPLSDRPGEILLEDVASGLGNECRYGGQLRGYYSVAEHSVRICRALRQMGADRATIAQGLLHDAAEAYLKDLPRPVKHGLPTYRHFESRLLPKILDRWGLPTELHPEVHRLDELILVAELHQVRPDVAHLIVDLPPMPAEFREGRDDWGWAPSRARDTFLAVARVCGLY